MGRRHASGTLGACRLMRAPAQRQKRATAGQSHRRPECLDSRPVIGAMQACRAHLADRQQPPPRGSRWRHRLPAVSFVPGGKPELSSPETASTTGFFEPRPRDRCRLPHFNLKLQFCPPRTAPVTRVNGANEPAREHRRSRLRPFVCRSRHIPRRTGSEATQHHAAICRPIRRSHEQVSNPPPRIRRFVRPAAACRPPRPLRLPAGRPSSRPATGGEPARTAGR